MLLIISVNHLNILDAIMHYSTQWNVDNRMAKTDFPVDEETEKSTQETEKGEEQEKYYTGHNYQLTHRFQLSAYHRFICYSTLLNKHPYKQYDIQPPKAA